MKRLMNISVFLCFSMLGLLLMNGCGGGNGDESTAFTPTMISSGSLNGQSPQIDMDANGNAIAVWQENEAGAGYMSANTYKSGVGWGNPTVISHAPASGTSTPMFSMNSTGNGIAIWTQGDGSNTMIYANHYTPGSDWATANLISASDSFVANPNIAISENGKAIAVWDQGDSPPRNIVCSIYAPSSNWSAPTIISSGVYSAYNPRVTVSNSGRFYVSFQENDGINNRIKVLSYDQTSTWNTSSVVSFQPPSTGSNANGSAISANSSGLAMVVWQHPGYLGRREIHGNKNGTAGGAFKGNDYPISIQNPYPEAGGSHYPDVAADNNGYHMVVWGQSNYGQTNIYASYFRVVAPGGAYWTYPVVISSGTGSPQLPRIIKVSNGNAFVTWEQYDYDLSRRHIYYNNYVFSPTDPAGGWGAAKRISDSALNSNSPAIAVNESGNIIVVWSQNDGTHNNIYSWTIN